MSSVRRWIRDHRLLALCLLAAALCMKALVPQGYMLAAPATGTKVLTVAFCFDGLERRSVDIAIPVTGKSVPGHDGPSGKDSGHCAFSALGFGALGGADAPLLALAWAFILALGFAPVTRHLVRRCEYLRPPLRGPPACI